MKLVILFLFFLFANGGDSVTPVKTGSVVCFHDTLKSEHKAVSKHDYKGNGIKLILGMTLLYKTSKYACLEGRNYIKEHLFWTSETSAYVVSNCQGVFRICGFTGETGLVRCNSVSAQRTECDTRKTILTISQKQRHSHAGCDGHYGFTGSKIWVDRGCEATFTVYYA